MAAQPGPEAQLLQQSTEVDDLNKGTYIHNMYGEADYLRVRAGFGQRQQFDTSLGLVESSTGITALEKPIVYLKHLGSKLIYTSFRHTQIVSVFLVRVNTGSVYVGVDKNKMGQYRDIHLVQIHDVTTGEKWEEVLYLQTAQISNDVPKSFGFYETTLDKNLENYPIASDKMFWLAQYGTSLLFGNPEVGVLSYQPCSFSGQRIQQLGGIRYDEDVQEHFSESSMIHPVMPNPGVFREAYKYFTSAEFPKVVAACEWAGRIAYVGDDGILYFSDISFPCSIAGPNFLAVRSNRALTAVAELNGNLVVFSDEEMYLYQASAGDIVSGGSLVKISDSVGCLGPNALIKAKGALFWTDKSGIYMSVNGSDLKTMSQGISSFWLKDIGISVPLTNCYAAINVLSVDTDGLSITLEYSSNDDAIHMAYHADRDLLMMVQPSQAMALVLGPKGWVVWVWESVDGDVTEFVPPTPPDPEDPDPEDPDPEDPDDPGEPQ